MKWQRRNLTLDEQDGRSGVSESGVAAEGDGSVPLRPQSRTKADGFHSQMKESLLGSES